MLSILSWSTNPSATSRRAYRQFMLDGIPTIGVLPGERYAICLNDYTTRRVKAIVSVDGLNPRTAKTAIAALDQPGYFAAPGGEVLVTNWQEDAHGGGALVFTSQERTVATYKNPDASAVGYISVMVYGESQPTHHTGFAHREPYYGNQFTNFDNEIAPGGGHYKSFETTRSASGEQAKLGTGIGPRINRPVYGSGELIGPYLIELLQVRYMPLDALRAHPGLPCAGHPTGFQSAPMADLSGVPREDGDSGAYASDEIRLGLSRFSNQRYL